MPDSMEIRCQRGLKSPHIGVEPGQVTNAWFVSLNQTQKIHTNILATHVGQGVAARGGCLGRDNESMLEGLA